jgi:hypothetical protein
MAFVVTKNSGNFESNPMVAGINPAVITDLAEREIPDFNDPSKKVKKIVARFVNADGQEAARFYTPSLNEKATLTKDLIGLGVVKANAIPDDLDLEQVLIGRQCVVVIAEGVSKKDGSPTAKIVSVTKPMAGQNVAAPKKNGAAPATQAAPPAKPAAKKAKVAPKPASVEVEDGSEIGDDDIPF